jgi:hypothetical protein
MCQKNSRSITSTRASHVAWSYNPTMRWLLPLCIGLLLGALYGYALAAGWAYVPIVNMGLWLLIAILPPYIFAVKGHAGLRAGALCGGGFSLAGHAVMLATGGGQALAPELQSAAELRASLLAWLIPYTLLFTIVFAVWCWLVIRIAAWIVREDVGVSLNP